MMVILKLRILSPMISPMIKFYKIVLFYCDNIGQSCVVHFAVSHDSLPAFLDSYIDSFGVDCVVRVLGSFEFPSDRFWYKML